LLKDTVVSFETRHGDSELGMTLSFRGLPHLDGLVASALAEQRNGASHEHVPAAGKVVTKDDLMQRFERLATRKDGGAAARSFAREQMASLSGDARALNNFAWTLLTDERFDQRFDDVALEYARAADAASGGVWQYLDTYALAQYRAGHVAEAIALE